MASDSLKMVIAAITVVLFVQQFSTVTASFGTREPPPLALREAQAACVKFLGICEDRLTQYNNSIYPNDPDTMCMVRCAGIIVGFWDDTQGFKLEGLVNLFPQLAQDSNVQQQILSCAEQRMSSCPPPDTCAKAYHAFRCFLEAKQNGFEAKQCYPQQPPKVFNGQEFIRSLAICAKILRIPQSLRELYMQGVFPNDDKTRSLIRCVGIRNELYDDVNGPNIAQLYSLFGAGLSEADFRQRANICMNANQPLSDAQDKSAQAYRKLYLCFKDSFGALIRANANAML